MSLASPAAPFTHCFPRNFTFYVADPICSIRPPLAAGASFGQAEQAGYRLLQATRLPLQIFAAGTAATTAEVNGASPDRIQLIALRRKFRSRVWAE